MKSYDWLIPIFILACAMTALFVLVGPVVVEDEVND